MVACQFVPPGRTAVGKIEGLGEVTLKYELPRNFMWTARIPARSD